MFSKLVSAFVLCFSLASLMPVPQKTFAARSVWVSPPANPDIVKNRVLLIPIDDRPAVTQFTEMIGRVGDVEVVIPPREMLGRFTKPGDAERIARWMLQQDFSKIDAAILSVDMLAYGGLMTSRTGAVSTRIAQDRLRVIEQLRRRYPRLPVYAFNAVQRVALSASASNRSYRDKLARWAVLADEDARRGKPELQAEFERLQRDLPPAAIADYLAARRRNLAVNLEMLERAKRGAVNELLLLQDDAQPFGLHRQDQQVLRGRIRQLGLTDGQAKLYNGADEGSSVLLSRAVLKRRNFVPRVRIVYSSEAGRKAVGTYEDQTIETSAERQIAASGARSVEAGQPHDYTLYVNAPAQTENDFQGFISQLVADVKSGKPVAVADVYFQNHWGGSDTRVIEALGKEKLLDKLIAYAAWNTPGNTIGTCVPHANMYVYAGRAVGNDAATQMHTRKAHTEFLLHRYIGDYGYHTIVRPEINNHIRRTLKKDTDELEPELYEQMNRRVAEEMKQVSEQIFDEHFKNRVLTIRFNNEVSGFEAATNLAPVSFAATSIKDLEIRLPWQRTFEVAVDYSLAFDANQPTSLTANNLSNQGSTPSRRGYVETEDERRWIDATLQSLSLRERIGQLIVVGTIGEYKNFNSEKFAEIRKQIEENGVGGVVFYRGDVNELAALTNEMQRRAKVPLLIAADFERGLPMQIKSGTSFTHNMGVAASGDVEASFREGRVIAEEMRAIGVHWLFAPVADVVNNPANSMVNVRSFGEDPARVAAHVAAFVRGVKAGGAMSTTKHFPGHGDTAIDSHITLPVLQLTRERMNRVELVPFQAAFEAGVDSVMTAHIALPKFTGDNLPASVSPKINRDLLRDEMSFDGIITTDSLGMNAITERYKGDESSLLAIKAGADVALLPPDPRGAIDKIEQAVGRGEITEARINESVRRILRAKYAMGLAENRFVDLSKVNSIVERPESVRDADAVAERGLTLVRNARGILPLDVSRSRRNLYFIIAGDKGDNEQGRVLQAEIATRVKGAKIVRIDERTTREEYEKYLLDAAQAETIVAAPFVKRAALKGTVALPDAQADFIKRLVAGRKPVAVVAFGSPYLLQQFPAANVYLVTYAVEDVAQRAAARALFGETSIGGKAPVSLKGLFERGAGLTTKARVPAKDATTNEALPHN